MIRRHPHVFGGQSYDSPEEQQADWEAIKAKERAEQGENTAPSHAISLVPAAFPALIRSQKVLKSRKTSSAFFAEGRRFPGDHGICSRSATDCCRTGCSFEPFGRFAAPTGKNPVFHQ